MSRRYELEAELRQIRRAERREIKAKRPISPKKDRGSTKEPLYLAYVRRLACSVGPLGCVGAVEAAHVRYPRPGEPPTGLQRKPPDSRAVPLCAGHHRTNPDAQHAGSERRFWAEHGIDPHALAERLYALYQQETP